MLTILGGKVVHGAGPFADLAPPLPPAMPDWSPVRRFGGHQRRADGSKLTRHALAPAGCGCARACGVHGHAHAKAYAGVVGDADQSTFWGEMGCACWAF